MKALLLSALVAVACATPAHASRIVFSCDANICFTTPDGRHRQQLTRDGRPGESAYAYPEIASTGRLIIYHRKHRLWAADSRVRGRRRIRDPGDIGGPQAARLRLGGREALFISGALIGPADERRLCRVATSPGARPRCGRKLPTDRSLWAWGPNGSIVSIDLATRREICITSLNGRCRRTLVRLTGLGDYLPDQPAISPSERYFAVGLGKDPGPEVRIALVDARTGRHVRDLTSGHRDHGPTWSPDGRSVAFQRDSQSTGTGGQASICFVRVAGGRVHCPVRDGYVGTPTWGR